MLRVFGCAYWPNLRPYNTRKLAFRSKQCVFLVYNNIHKGFKCLDVSEGRVYISRDVVFDETEFPFAALHPNAGARLRSEILLLPDHLTNLSGGTNCDSISVSSPASNQDCAATKEPNTTSEPARRKSGENSAPNNPYFMLRLLPIGTDP